jgi:hypothetical protein
MQLPTVVNCERYSRNQLNARERAFGYADLATYKLGGPAHE